MPESLFRIILLWHGAAGASQPWGGLVGWKTGEKCFVLSLSDTLLLRLPGWYKIINTVATHAALRGASGVTLQKMRENGYFPSQALVCSWGHGRWSAEPSCRAVPGGQLHVLEESLRAGSDFLASKLRTVLQVP